MFSQRKYNIALLTERRYFGKDGAISMLLLRSKAKFRSKAELRGNAAKR